MNAQSLICLFALPLAACGAGYAAAPDHPLDVRATMVQQVNPQIMEIWDIGNAAMSDAGGIDPSLMDQAQWDSLAGAATQLEASSAHMAGAQRLLAAAPGNMPGNEGEAGVIAMADVQKYLDANPQGFAVLAAAMGTTATALAGAARAQDADAAGPLIEQINADCENCHSQYWYPEN